MKCLYTQKQNRIDYDSITHEKGILRLFSWNFAVGGTEINKVCIYILTFHFVWWRLKLNVVNILL